MVVVGNSAVGNQITQDLIFANTGQAIDLGDDGITANGIGTRVGPNNLQNRPFIYAETSGPFQGTLEECAPNTEYDIEFFASATSGPHGSGEAQNFLGSMDVTTGGDGSVEFNIPFAPSAALRVL